MQRAEKAVKPATDSPQRGPAAGRMVAPGASPTVFEQHTHAIAQRELAQLIAQSPHVAAQRALNESVHNSPRMLAQRQQLRGIVGEAAQLQGGLEDAAAAAGAARAHRQDAGPDPRSHDPVSQAKSVLQRKPVVTRVTGRTHLVYMVGQTIYGGHEGPEVTEQQLEIETDDRILSRRGPNQETYGEADRHGGHIYPWVRVLRIGDDPAPKNCYVREDTLTVRPSALAETNSAERPELRERRERQPAVHPTPLPHQPAGPWFRVESVTTSISQAQEMCRKRAMQEGRSALPAQPSKLKHNEILGLLEACAELQLIETRAINKSLFEYRCLVGFHDFVEQQMTKAAEGEQGWASMECVRGHAVLLACNISISSEIAERVPDESIYRDWYHDVVALMTMLAERQDLPKAAMVKLLKFMVMRNQLQAPFDEATMVRTGRQTSPLASEDYARGMRTRLWSVATKIQLERLERMCIEAVNNSNKQPMDEKGEAKFIKEFNRAFYVVATPRPFPYANADPTIRHNMPDDPTTMGDSFFPALQLQVLKIEGPSQDFKGKVSSHMGARGLRSSLGESAQMIAEALTERIKRGDLQGALAMLEPDFREKTATGKQAKTPLSSIQYDSRGLVAPAERDPESHRLRDPLLTSTKEQLEGGHGKVGGLLQAYEHCLQVLQKDGLPDLMVSNFKVFENLVGDGILALFGYQTPAQVTATVTDALEDIADLMTYYHNKLGMPTEIAARKFLLERYYEKMQILHEAVRFQLSWRGGDPKLLHEGIKHMLPEEAARPTSTHAAPHGLAMIDQINRALGAEKTVGVLKSSYYETPGLFEGHKTFANVEEEDLLDRDLIVLEPHPNNAEERHVEAHDPVKLLTLLARKKRHRTVLMDITLNHMGEEEIANVLKTAAPMIQSGDLNLVLVQSGTKFLQHGMDIVSLGIAAVFNNSDHWVTFNTEMKRTEQSVPEDDALYLGRMLTTSKTELGNYLDRIRRDTELLRKKLLDRKLQALEVTFSSDARTVYVAIAPTQACIERVYRKKVEAHNQVNKNKAPSPEEFAMHDAYRRILETMKGLGLVTRSSFGFNMTNLGECLTTIRITPGIEDDEFFEAYAERIAEVDKHLTNLMSYDV
jgi:hypothetical protein